MPNMLKPPFTTRGGRWILFLLVLGAGVSLVSSTILRVYGLTAKQGQLSLSQLGDAVFLASMTFMHVIYMLLVVTNSVLKEIRFPWKGPELYKRYLTAVLCLAYAAPLVVYLTGLSVAALST